MCVVYFLTIRCASCHKSRFVTPKATVAVPNAHFGMTNKNALLMLYPMQLQLHQALHQESLKSEVPTFLVWSSEPEHQISEITTQLFSATVICFLHLCPYMSKMKVYGGTNWNSLFEKKIQMLVKLTETKHRYYWCMFNLNTPSNMYLLGKMNQYSLQLGGNKTRFVTLHSKIWPYPRHFTLHANLALRVRRW